MTNTRVSSNPPPAVPVAPPRHPLANLVDDSGPTKDEMSFYQTIFLRKGLVVPAPPNMSGFPLAVLNHLKSANGGPLEDERPASIHADRRGSFVISVKKQWAEHLDATFQLDGFDKNTVALAITTTLLSSESVILHFEIRDVCAEIAMGPSAGRTSEAPDLVKGMISQMGGQLIHWRIASLSAPDMPIPFRPVLEFSAMVPKGARVPEMLDEHHKPHLRPESWPHVCYFCRRTGHERKDCPSSPPCGKCSSTAHKTERCSPSLRARQALGPVRSAVPRPTSPLKSRHQPPSPVELEEANLPDANVWTGKRLNPVERTPTPDANAPKRVDPSKFLPQTIIPKAPSSSSTPSALSEKNKGKRNTDKNNNKEKENTEKKSKNTENTENTETAGNDDTSNNEEQQLPTQQQTTSEAATEQAATEKVPTNEQAPILMQTIDDLLTAVDEADDVDYVDPSDEISSDEDAVMNPTQDESTTESDQAMDEGIEVNQPALPVPLPVQDDLQLEADPTTGQQQ